MSSCVAGYQRVVLSVGVVIAVALYTGRRRYYRQSSRLTSVEAAGRRHFTQPSLTLSPAGCDAQIPDRMLLSLKPDLWDPAMSSSPINDHTTSLHGARKIKRIRCHFTFLLVTHACVYKISPFLAVGIHKLHEATNDKMPILC